MRGIGQKAFLRDDGVLQAVQQIVHRHHQRCHFHGHGFVVQGAQVVGLARTDALFQFRQRLDAAHQRQPDQQHRQGQKGKLGQHHALDDLGGQHRALFSCLGHLHQGRVFALGIQPDPGVGHAHFQAPHLVIADVHFVAAALVFIGRGHGQIAFTAEVFATSTAHLVVHQIGLVGAQQFTGGLGQVELHALLWPQLDLLGQGLHVVDQSAVKGLVGQALCHQPGQGQADGPQQQERRQHPVENFPEQGALFTLEEPHTPATGFHGGVILGAVRAGVTSTGLSPEFFPSNSQDRARWRCGSGLFRSSCAGGGCTPRWRCC